MLDPLHSGTLAEGQERIAFDWMHRRQVPRPFQVFVTVNPGLLCSQPLY